MTSDIYKENFQKGLTILIGGSGSGKSEFAIMYARNLVNANRKNVVFVDLDTIKPMFRSQEFEKTLEKEGVKLIISSVPHSDMPSISPQMVGMIGDDTNNMVVDVGGDAIGARILASIKHNMKGRDHNLYYILNGSRPFNDNAQSAAKELQRIESVSGLKVTGVISNTHMLDETTHEMIEEGIEISREISEILKIDFIGVMVQNCFVDKVSVPDNLELFEVERMLNPYWMRD